MTDSETTTRVTALAALAALVALTAHDRCDRCGAQAYVKLKHAVSDHDLMFCGHHFGRFEAGLGSEDFTVVADHRKKLTVR